MKLTVSLIRAQGTDRHGAGSKGDALAMPLLATPPDSRRQRHQGVGQRGEVLQNLSLVRMCRERAPDTRVVNRVEIVRVAPQAGACR